MGKPVVMGRKTYLSIGKPLPGRTNIVVTRDRRFPRRRRGRGARVSRRRSTRRATMRARAAPDEIMVIGGTEIFPQTMDLADRLEITHVHRKPAGDVYFPAIDPEALARDRAQRQPAGPQDDASVSFVTYQRI